MQRLVRAALLSVCLHSSAGITLRNALIEVKLTSSGILSCLSDLRTTPPTDHPLTPPADGIDWSVALSDFNASTGAVTLEPAGCDPAVVNTSLLPASASFTFYHCNGPRNGPVECVKLQRPTWKKPPMPLILLLLI